MPNTPVRAAAEGMPEINRRYFLTNTVAAGAAAASVTVPAVAQAASMSPMENVGRLAVELSEALTVWMNDLGYEGNPDLWRAVVYPSSRAYAVNLHHLDRATDAKIFELLAEFELANAEMVRLGKIFDEHERAYYDGKPNQPKLQDFHKSPAWTDETTLREIRAYSSGTDAYEKAKAKYERANNRFRRKSGYDAADEAYKAAMNAAANVVRELLETPAQTPQGMLVKIKLAGDWGEEYGCLEFLEADFRRIIGEAA